MKSKAVIPTDEMTIHREQPGCGRWIAQETQHRSRLQALSRGFHDVPQTFQPLFGATNASQPKALRALLLGGSPSPDFDCQADVSAHQRKGTHPNSLSLSNPRTESGKQCSHRQPAKDHLSGGAKRGCLILVDRAGHMISGSSSDGMRYPVFKAGHGEARDSHRDGGTRFDLAQIAGLPKERLTS